MKKIVFFLFFLFFAAYFFKSFFLHNLLPIPSDTIVGLYHPFRDMYAKDYPRGIPFKNFLITDPVRQEYPWRYLATSLEKKMQLPLWNPYSFSGYPLLANFQTAAFYPLNMFLFIMPFAYGWSLLVFLQPLLAGVFMYMYLKNLKLHGLASFVGAITYAFCGFSIAWLEWNTIMQVALWIPLILLAKDKLLKKWTFFWTLVLLLAEISAFFGGHIQVLFYALIITNSYLFLRIFQKTKQENKGKNFIFSYAKIYLPFLLVGILMYIVTAVQWIPTLQFINFSARGVDQANWQAAGWFIPWEHIIQFFVPDFFGNPTTLNYWGVWNYGEFIGFVGIIPLLMSLFAIFFRHDKKTYFFSCLLFFALIFSLPTPFAKLPFILHIPFLSTSQPTRLLFVVDFSLAVLSALGFDFYMKKRRKIFIPLSIFSLVFIFLWIFVYFSKRILPSIHLENILVAKHNLIFPTTVFIAVSVITVLFAFLKPLVSRKISITIYMVLILITVVDLFRFGQKFIPFTSASYLYPQTKTTQFLQKNIGDFRFMNTDSRLLPPNFSNMYNLQTIEGYDPLYLRNYGEFVAAMQREKADISSPFGFNRIITPHNFSSSLINILGVKYILSLEDISLPQFKKVYEEGQTKVYENENVYPRTFFVEEIIPAQSKQDVINKIFQMKDELRKKAIVVSIKNEKLTIGSAKIVLYSPNRIIIETENSGKGFLLVTDTYYPTWHATEDGKEVKIYSTDYTFRGIFVPAGKHTVVFYDTLF